VRETHRIFAGYTSRRADVTEVIELVGIDEKRRRKCEGTPLG